MFLLNITCLIKFVFKKKKQLLYYSYRTFNYRTLDYKIINYKILVILLNSSLFYTFEKYFTYKPYY